MSVRKIMVLGANSFSGQDFVDLLLDDPENQVLGVSRSPERSDLFLKYKLRKELSHYRYAQLDLNKDSQALLQLLDQEKPSHIVNFAAQSEVAPSWEHPDHWFETNTGALSKLVNHLRRQTYLKKYLHVSSPEAYGSCIGNVTEDASLNPSTPYAASKAAADMLLRTYQKQYGFPLVTVRGTNVYGARQQLFKIIPRSVIYMKLGKKVELHGGGVAIKSYIHVRDISRGELAILDRGTVGSIYNLSPDQGVSVRTVVELICERIKRPFDQAVTMVGERPGQDAAYVIDSSKARREFGWAPIISLKDGLSDVIDWVEKYWATISHEPLEYRHKA
jgi:dTDP-glucose 4,6-dehydratase